MGKMCSRSKACILKGCQLCIACRRVIELGGKLSWFIDEVKTKGKAPVRDDMWYSGNVVPRNYGSKVVMR